MKTVLHVKTNKNLKDDAQKLAKEIGLPLSIVINGLLQRFVAEKGITFGQRLIPTSELKQVIKEIEKESKNKSKGPFTNKQEIKNYLNTLKNV